MTQGAEEAASGFAFRFYKDKEAFIYRAKDQEDDRYTIANIGLDVFPLQLHCAIGVDSSMDASERT
jgi:hypothetical protein